MKTQPAWITWTRRALIALGSSALVYAALGIIASPDTRFAYFRFLALVLIGHELILMPLAIGIGVLIGRFTGVTVRPVIQAAIFATAVITVVSLPALTGRGRSPDLPSALSRDYLRGWLIFLALIWIAALAVIIARRIRHQPNRQ